jgi:ABC-type nitrate/sulfonate/bicarbonate transport system permease component
MFAILIIFGLIGLLSDLLLRQLRRRTAPWSEGSR